MTLHEDEVAVDEEVVGRLLRRQRPDLADLPIRLVGGGTDNTMYRLGDDHLVRMPRTPDKTAGLAKELRWLPRFAPLVPYEIPRPVFAGVPSEDFGLSWVIYHWIDGVDVTPETVDDWAPYGRDLATFVRAMHQADLMGASREGDLNGYRGGLLTPHRPGVAESFATARDLGAALDLDRLEQLWLHGCELPAPTADHVWLHGDLRPGNLLVRDGKLCAVIDFGGITIGFPDAEHAAVWDLPPAARDAYRAELDVDDLTWQRARAWAVMIGISGVAYYWHTFPAFLAECLQRLENIVTAED